MAFGSYMPKDQKVSKASVIVVTADTGVALFAGLAIFPLVFFFALDPTAGTELVFKTMTTAFAEMGSLGQFIGPLFCRNEDEAYESTDCNTGDSKVTDEHYALARRIASQEVMLKVGYYRNRPYNQ